MEQEFIKNEHSGLAKQPFTKNWGSFHRKDRKEQLTTQAMKLACRNKDKPKLVGNSFSALKGMEFVRKEKIVNPYEKRK